MIALRTFLCVRSLTWWHHKPIPRYQKMSTCIQISCAVQWKISNIADLLKKSVFGGPSLLYLARAMRETFAYGHKFTGTSLQLQVYSYKNIMHQGDTPKLESAIIQATLTSTCAQPYIWSWQQNARLCSKLMSGVLLVVEHLIRKSSPLLEWNTHSPFGHLVSIWHH